MRATQHDERRTRTRRRRGIGIAVSLVAVVATVSACSSAVGGSNQSVARPGNAKNPGVFTGRPSARPGAAPPPSSGSRVSSSAAESAGHGTTVTTSSVGGLGTVLVAGNGRPVYLRTKDRGTRSTCYGPCARSWPPVTSATSPHATGGADASRLGTTTRRNGQRQVTYAGHPLYYHRGESRRSPRAKGEGLTRFGGTWYAVSPRGTRVRKPGS
jgi:predicted lipoprotein with Yx(FWY)xxD motif